MLLDWEGETSLEFIHHETRSCEKFAHQIYILPIEILFRDLAFILQIGQFSSHRPIHINRSAFTLPLHLIQLLLSPVRPSMEVFRVMVGLLQSIFILVISILVILFPISHIFRQISANRIIWLNILSERLRHYSRYREQFTRFK